MSHVSSGIGGSVVVAAEVVTVSGNDGGAVGGGGHASSPTLGTPVGILGSSACKAGLVVEAGAGCTQPTRKIDHGEEVDSQPQGATQRTHAPYTLGLKPSTWTSMTAGRRPSGLTCMYC